jgi:hypothetical protein
LIGCTNEPVRWTCVYIAGPASIGAARGRMADGSGVGVNRFPWRNVEWYWGDERLVPYDHRESNYRMVHKAMLAKAPI